MNNQGKSKYYKDQHVEGDASKLFIASVTILSFAGACALYGLIVALIVISSSDYRCGD